MEKIGLVLEGGGMRGIYTSAVLDYFMKKNIEFEYIIGVSAGVFQAMSYMSHQRGRSRKIYINFSKDPRYISSKRLLTKGEIFGFEFIFGELAHELLPFNYKRFLNSKTELVITATNCITGKAEYFYKSKLKTMSKITAASMASSSMPLMALPVLINNVPYLDGTEADPIPVKKAFMDGCTKTVVVLTRDLSYIKKQDKAELLLAKTKYKNMPGIVSAMEKRPNLYNQTRKYIFEEEKEGNCFVIAPSSRVKISRTERSEKKLASLYNQGFNDTEHLFDKMMDFIRKEN